MRLDRLGMAPRSSHAAGKAGPVSWLSSRLMCTACAGQGVAQPWQGCAVGWQQAAAAQQLHNPIPSTPQSAAQSQSSLPPGIPAVLACRASSPHASGSVPVKWLAVSCSGSRAIGGVGGRSQRKACGWPHVLIGALGASSITCQVFEPTTHRQTPAIADLPPGAAGEDATGRMRLAACRSSRRLQRWLGTPNCAPGGGEETKPGM